jgi:hypothetical protein
MEEAQRKEQERQQKIARGGTEGALIGAGIAAAATVATGGAALPIIAAGAGLGQQAGRALRGGQADPVAILNSAAAIDSATGQAEQTAAERAMLEGLTPPPSQAARTRDALRGAVDLEPGLDSPVDVAISDSVAPKAPDVLAHMNAQLSDEDTLRSIIDAAGGSRRPMATAARGLQIFRSLRPGQGNPIALSKDAKLVDAQGRTIAENRGTGTDRPEIRNDPFGVPRYVESGEPVFPNVEAAVKLPFEGSGVPVQDSNNLVTLGERIAAEGWDDLSPQEKRSYTLSYQRATRPEQITVSEPNGTTRNVNRPALYLDPELYPAPKSSGARPSQMASPSTTTETAEEADQGKLLPPGWQVVGENRKAIPVGDAAKISVLQGARTTFDGVKKRLLNPDGSVNRSLVTSMGAALPFTAGRQVRQEYLDVLEARIRAESGAAVPDTEITRLAERLLPSPLDSDEAVLSKMQRVDQFINGSLELADIGRGILSDKSISAHERERQQRLEDLQGKFNLTPVR